MILLAITSFTTGFAQENIMRKSETTVTKTIVKDNAKVDVSTKAVTETEKQAIEIEGQVDRNNFNTSLTRVIAGSEVSYSNDGMNYLFESEENGYKMISVPDKSAYAIIRPSSREGYYICSQNGDNSMSYFDQDGNFVVESYDLENDNVILTTYKLVQESTVVKKK